jgi:glucan phosphoethanolaminetransferase (alkaline phosphatase superfamily)
VKSSKAAIAISAFWGKICSIAGYFFGILFFITMIVGLNDNTAEAGGRTAGIIMCLILVIINVLLILKGRKTKRRIRRYRKYVNLISVEQIRSLGELASATSQSVDFVKSDLQKMIDKKFFVNACIDLSTNEIRIGDASPQVKKAGTPAAEQPPEEMETVQCSGCGATNVKPKGKTSVCEYCGSPLK